MYNAQAGSSSSSAHANAHSYTVPGELTVVELLHTHDRPSYAPHDPDQPTAPGQQYAHIERVSNLMSLADPPPGEKPAHAYSTMIRAAILGTQDKRLLLEDIYTAIETRFPFFATAGAGWKNSVRHNLSLNPCFVKVPRPLTDPGKGSYWVVDEEVDPKTGMQRVRNKSGSSGKRGSRKKKAEPVEIDELAGDEDGTGEPSVEEPIPYDPSRPAFVNPKDMAMLPVLDAQGHMVWKNVWRNELTRLRIFSQEQDAHGIREDLWQQLVFGVRNTLSTLVPGDPDNMQLQHAIQIPMPLHHPPAES